MTEFWSVAVDAPIETALTYRSPVGLEDSSLLGRRVIVPLGRRKVTGIVVSAAGAPPEESFKIKEILSVETDFPALSKSRLEWCLWLSNYYLHPLGEVLAAHFPPLQKSGGRRKARKAPLALAEKLESEVPPLMRDQAVAASEVLRNSDNFNCHLLFGVTGSGKTEVYLEVIQNVLAQGRRALVLVPEISLTPQLLHRFSRRFGNQIAVLHSHLTEREKTDQWWSIIEGDRKILIGARSALFCPIENLGLIVVDEEHEPSFKQEEKFRYHARDAAIMLAAKSNCPIILGSATPSLESWNNALTGKYKIHRLVQRYREAPMPDIKIIDLRSVQKHTGASWLSLDLHRAMEDTLGRGRQVALFLNRRGTAPVVICQACGKVYECSNCDISLTLHQHHDLICHYCNYHEPYKVTCKQCNERKVLPVGLGTEQVERDLRFLFPEVAIARADRDEVQSREDLEKLISDMEEGRTQLLIGTQMIAKGLDFPKLDLVGFVFADVGFSIPDFRSVERSYQLLTQMSGRAGRHARSEAERGRVFIQTLNPDHPCLKHVLSADFVSFAEEELAARTELTMPPLGKLAALKYSSSDLETGEQFSAYLHERMRVLQSQSGELNIEVLGPAPSPIEKLRNRFRFHVLLKSRDAKSLHIFIHRLIGQGFNVPSRVRFGVDIDPIQLL